MGRWVLFPSGQGYAMPTKTLLSPLGCKGVCANLASANEPGGCGLPLHGIQPELIFRTAVEFDFPVDTFFTLSPIYFSPDLSVSFILSQVAIRWLNSQSKIPLRVLKEA